MFKTLLKQIGDYKKDAILTPVFVVMEVIMEVIIPIMMAAVIDYGLADQNMGRAGLVTRMISFRDAKARRKAQFLFRGEQSESAVKSLSGNSNRKNQGNLCLYITGGSHLGSLAFGRGPIQYHL